MALTKQKKSEILVKVKDELANIGSLAFVNFDKFTVKDTIDLRRQLQAAGAKYMVVKKTLLKRVLADKNIEGTLPELGGEIAIAYGADMLTPAREVYNYGKDHKEVLVKIVGGIFEGGYKNAEDMISIATIPSREVLLSKFLNIINSPRQRFAIVLDAYAKSKE